MPYEEYRRVRASYDAACEGIYRIEQQFAEVRPLIRAARDDAKAAFMWEMAKHLLRPHDVARIEEQCELFAGIALEIPASLEKKSKGEMEAREDTLEDRRQQARRSLEVAKDRGTVMYAGRHAEPQQPATPPADDMADRLKQLAEKFNNGRAR